MLTPRPTRYSFRFGVDYRTRTSLRTRYVEVVAERLGDAASLAMQRVRNSRGVVKIDRCWSVGNPIQSS